MPMQPVYLTTGSTRRLKFGKLLITLKHTSPRKLALDGRPGSSVYDKTSKPCFWTTASNLSASPLGRLAPVSHFSTVLSLVLR